MFYRIICLVCLHFLRIWSIRFPHVFT